MVKGTKKNNQGKSRRYKAIKEGDCIFPFIHEGKVFNECIPFEEKFNGRRCATEVDKDENMVKWGYCPKKKTIKKKKSSNKVSKKSNSSEKELRLPKWWNNSCFIDSVIACLFFRDNSYLKDRLLRNDIIPFTTDKKRIEENNNFRDETSSELIERIQEINNKCPMDARSAIRENLINVYNYIHDNIDSEELPGNKVINSKAKTKSRHPRRLRNLRDSLSDCKLENFEDFTDGSQREANEFLKYLLAIFPDDKNNLEENIYYTNDVNTEIRGEKDIKKLKGKTCKMSETRKGDVYFFVSPSDISSAPTNCNISYFLNTKDDIKEGSGEGPWYCEKQKSKKFSRRIKFNNCIESRYLIFDLLRAIKLSGGGSNSNTSSNESSTTDTSESNSSNSELFLDNKITPEKEITLKNGNKFRFVSSVIRTKGMGSAHFTSFVLKNDIWHYFDDNPSGTPYLNQVGTYEELLEYKDGKVKDSVMYFYEPV